MTHYTEQGQTGDRSIVVKRTFEAPAEEVFDAFTSPQKISQWFAPQPLTVPRAEIDLRVGGRQTLVMRDQDGKDYTSTGIYKEIDRPKRLVMTDSMEQMPTDWVDLVNEARGQAAGTAIPDGVVTVTFDEMEGRTEVAYREDFDSEATRDAFVKMQMIEGLQGSFDNLERVLAQAPTMAT